MADDRSSIPMPDEDPVTAMTDSAEYARPGSGEGTDVTGWWMIPTLYFTQAIPVTLVQELAQIVYKDFGIENDVLTRWTSLIAIPWTIKALWGPLIDLNGTKRSWVILFQLLLALSILGWAVLAGVNAPFPMAMALLFFVAVFSASCDIATDGFYLLSYSRDRQAKFVGLQSLSYRMGRLFCAGLLVTLAGILQHERGATNQAAWFGSLGIAGGLYLAVTLLHRAKLPHPTADIDRQQTPQEIKGNVIRTSSVIGFALSMYFALNSVVRLGAWILWKAFDSVVPTFNDKGAIAAGGSLKGWFLTNTQLGEELVQMPVCLVGIFLFGSFMRKSLKGTEMGEAFSSFIRQPGFVAILAFLTLYRLGEAMVVKMAALFLKDDFTKGGLAMPNEKVGVIVGTIGVVGIILGGIIGGPLVAKWGLKKAFIPLAIVMHAPNLLYLWASVAKPGEGPIAVVAFAEQFGYGIGYAAYSVYIQRMAQRGNYPTAHYAIATAMGALCIMSAGIISGIVQTNFGYTALFASAVAAAIPGTALLFFLPQVDEK